TFNRERLPRIHQRPVVHVTLELPPVEVRAAMWRERVPELLPADADALAERFATTGGVIDLAARADAAGRAPEDGPPDADAPGVAVRNQLHDRILRLGRRLDMPHTLDDLIVDEEVADSMLEIAASVRERRQVRDTWGFRGARGISVLFSG